MPPTALPEKHEPRILTRFMYWCTQRAPTWSRIPVPMPFGDANPLQLVRFGWHAVTTQGMLYSLPVAPRARSHVMSCIAVCCPKCCSGAHRGAEIVCDPSLSGLNLEPNGPVRCSGVYQVRWLLGSVGSTYRACGRQVRSGVHLPLCHLQKHTRRPGVGTRWKSRGA